MMYGDFTHFSILQIMHQIYYFEQLGKTNTYVKVK